MKTRIQKWGNSLALRPKFVGARIKRREDPALIQGLGQYVDDILLAGTRGDASGDAL